MAKEPSTRVQRKRAAKRDLIVDAAFEAVSRDGPADFSLNQLARDLDYTPGALYWYFPSKEALVVEVQSRAFRELRDKLAESRRAWHRVFEDEPPAVQRIGGLLGLARYYLQLERTDPQYARMISFSLDPRVWLDDGTAQQLVPILGELFGQVAEPLVAAQHESVLQPGDALGRAVQYFAALQGMLLTSKLSRLSNDLFDVERLGMNSAETLLLGWGAALQVVERAKQVLAEH